MVPESIACFSSCVSIRETSDDFGLGDLGGPCVSWRRSDVFGVGENRRNTSILFIYSQRDFEFVELGLCDSKVGRAR